METSTVLTQVIEEKRYARRRNFKMITQAIVMFFIVALVSLFLTSAVVFWLHMVTLIPMAIVCVCITIAVTFLGLWVLVIWLDLK